MNLKRYASLIIMVLLVGIGNIIFSVCFQEKQVFAQEKSGKQHSKDSILEQIRINFYNSVSVGPVGRFQAVKLTNSSVFIIDTKEGHLWAWSIHKMASGIVYQGQITPGEKMGDVIDRLLISIPKAD